jgi:hypothetical protein
MAKKSIDFGIANPCNPHSPKTSNHPINLIPSVAKKDKKPIVDPQLPTTPINSKHKKL